MLSNSSSLVIKSNSFNQEDENVDEFEENDVKLPEKILTHSRFNFPLIKNKTIQSEYLKSRKWKYIYEEEDRYIELNFKNIEKNLKKEDIDILLENINKSSLNEVLNNNQINEDKYSIGVLHSLEYLIEKMYDFSLINEENMLSDMSRLKQLLFKYRRLKKDGNSFYRGIIFSFLENVIFTKNILLMKEILILFYEKISEKNKNIIGRKNVLNSFEKIEKNIVINILYIIIKQMEKQLKEKNIELTPYIILLKVFLFCNEFDEGMIFFTRYLIYEYIQENEIKLLNENKKIKILELIPNIFKIANDPKNDFYKNLITLGCEAYHNSIYSYIVPYVFNCTLNVLVYKKNPEDALIQQLEYRKEKHTEYEINLLFKEKDFDIYYKNYFYTKYYSDLDNLIANKKDEELNIFNSEEKDKNNNNINKHISRRISSQYPDSMTKTNLQLSTQFKDPEKKEGRKYVLKCSESNMGNVTNFGGENKYVNTIKNYDNVNNVKYERLEKKKNTLKEKDLSVSRIYKMLKRGENCHNKDCPSMITKENIFNLCDMCIIKEIKTYILQTYLMYLQIDINKDSAYRLKQYFAKAEIQISEANKIPLMQIIQELNLNFDELFTAVRTNICLWCWKNLENNNYFIELPCKCKICSKKCFENYTKIVEEKNDKVMLKEQENDDKEIIIMPMNECPCGYEYKLKDFVYMIKTLQEKKLNSCINTYLKQIKNNWKWDCVFCKKNFSKKIKYIRFYFKDKNLDKIFKNNKIEYKHSVCEKCALDKNIKIGDSMKIFCDFCDSEHDIEQIKNVGENNKTDSDCIIL